MVGPVPMVVRAGVAGEVTLDVLGNLDCLGMSMDALAASNLNLTASWSINARIIRAGIEGQLRLLDVALPAETHARLAPADACAHWGASHSRSLTSLSGRVTLFTIVRFLWFQTRHDLDIARWSGINMSNSGQTFSDKRCLE